MIRPFFRAAAAAFLVVAGVAAHAETTLTWGWTDIHCGVIAADGTRTQQPCDARSFSALVMPGESVFVGATLHYSYSDDGLALDPGGNWGFVTGCCGSFRRVTHEAGALYLYSNQCSSLQECMGRPFDRVDTFNPTSSPLILGDNDVPDTITGELGLFATSGQSATSPFGAMRTAFVDALGFGHSGIAAAVPEPSSCALLLAGLAMLYAVTRRRARGPAIARR